MDRIGSKLNFQGVFSPFLSHWNPFDETIYNPFQALLKLSQYPVYSWVFGH